jgi:hypothetical protein
MPYTTGTLRRERAAKRAIISFAARHSSGDIAT